MISNYFTLGQSHAHRLDGHTLDCDVVIEINAIDNNSARERMFELFGDKWSFQYENLPDMDYFPRGIFNVDLGWI